MARTYGTIATAFWSHPTVRQWSPNAKLVAIYLMTGPESNGIGCYFLPPEIAAGRLRLEVTTISDHFEELERDGFVVRCRRTDYIMLPTFLKWNPVNSPKVAVSYVRLIDNLPSQIEFFDDFMAAMKSYGKHWPDEFRERLDRVCHMVSDRVCHTVSHTRRARAGADPIRSNPIRTGPDRAHPGRTGPTENLSREQARACAHEAPPTDASANGSDDSAGATSPPALATVGQAGESQKPTPADAEPEQRSRGMPPDERAYLESLGIMRRRDPPPTDDRPDEAALLAEARARYGGTAMPVLGEEAE